MLYTWYKYAIYTGDRGRTDTPKREQDFESCASANSATPAKYYLDKDTTTKAVTGFEPVIKVLQTHALPLGYTAISK